MKIQNIGLALGLTGLGVVSQVTAASALTWNWGYTTVNGIVASGTWESDGTNYDSSGSTNYNILSISGTRNGSPIIGGQGSFRWNGSNILVDYIGVRYNSILAPQPQNAYSIRNTNATISPANEEARFCGFCGRFDIVGSHLSSAAMEPPVTAVPFDFNPTEGAALGIPLFIGLSMLRKKKLAQKSAVKKVAELVS